MAENKIVNKMLGQNPLSFLQLTKKLLVALFFLGLFMGTGFKVKTKEIQTPSVFVENEYFGTSPVEFELTVPLDYDHRTQIDRFQKKVKNLKTTYHYNDSLTSENFAKATNKLVSGKTYKVKIFPILGRVTSKDCIDFLRKQNAILVGGQGLTLAHELKADEFPVEKFTLSFDEKEALWKKSDGSHWVPYVGNYSESGWFSLSYFESVWNGNHCLLCFCEL